MNTVKKHIPERRCIGCGEHFPKPTLIRIVRTPEGEITLDFVGKRSGRGAYLCKSAECLKKAKKQGRLGRALECEIPEEIYQNLEGELKQ